jgi:peroxiredoxin
LRAAAASRSPVAAGNILARQSFFSRENQHVMISFKTFALTAAAFALLHTAHAAEMSVPASGMAKDAMSSGDASMMPGLKVGDRAPEFTLKDANGHEVSLASLLKKGKVALVFFRSADWCPYCKAQLKDLQDHLAAIEATGVQLVGISYDSTEVLAKSAPKIGVTFPLLSDVGSKTIDAFGIRNHEATGRGVGIPHPAIFILDQSGVIRVKLMREGFKERPDPSEIIAGVKSIGSM